MAIEHDYFGVVGDDPNGGLRWEETLALGEQQVAVTVVGDEEEPGGVLDLAAALLQGLGGFDMRARDALIAQLSERESATTRYIDERVDALGEDLIELLVHNSGDIAMDVLRSLQLGAVVIDLDANEKGDAFAAFEYAIDPEEPEQTIAVAFDIRADVVAVELGW